MTITDHGVPVYTARQWVTGLSPNAAGDGWNLIIQSWVGPNPSEWIVNKDITGVHGAPTQTIDQFANHIYGDILYQYSNGKQLRAPNGRIFWLCFGNYVAVYDPTTEHVSLLGPLAESPAVDPNASWGPYNASFDTAGNLWLATEESHFRASAIIFVDTAALTMVIKGYVGSGALSYSTYGKATAPDVGTSTKHVYEAFGENPWQLWDCDLAAVTADATTDLIAKTAHGLSTGQVIIFSSTGSVPGGTTIGVGYYAIVVDADHVRVATSSANAFANTYVDITSAGSGTITVSAKLYEVSSSGNIQFTNIVGQGWVATIDTALGQPSNVRTQWWCLDGALYAYTVGVSPPGGLARTVTPTTNPLVNPPGLDLAGSVGVFGWRAHGSTGPYAYVNYNVTYRAPTMLESLVQSNGPGIVANAQQYNGFVQYFEPADTHVWYGPLQSVSEGVRLNVGGLIYMAAYPNGTFLSYNPDAAWQLTVNPLALGAFGLQGIQFAGIKYADHIAFAPLAGASGRFFCTGSRERNGSGSGIGSWDKTTKAFAGTFSATGMSSVLPTGLCVLDGISRVVMASRLITPPGDAHLFVFDYALNLVSSVVVIAGLANLGDIFETSTPNVITGIVQGSGNSIGLWQYNVATLTFVQYVELPIIGTLGRDATNGILVYCQRLDGSVWIMSGNNLVRVDISALTATVQQDLTAYAPVVKLSFDAASTTLWFAGGVNSGVGGAQLFSIAFSASIVCQPLVGRGNLFSANLVTNGRQSMTCQPLVGRGRLFAATLVKEGDAVAGSGANDVDLVNDESTNLTRCQPVYSSGDGSVRLAVANGSGSAIVVGLVADAIVTPANAGTVRLGHVLEANPAEWDVVCGTTGGLAPRTVYYLHTSIPGRLTATVPSDGQEIVAVLYSLSPTLAIVKPTRPKQ